MTGALEAGARASHAAATAAFAAVVAGLLAHHWFASAPLPFVGPNILLAFLATLLAVASLCLAAWSSRDAAVVGRRVAGIAPVVALATLLPLWALVVYLATDTLDATRLAKMVLGIGVLLAVFVSADSLRRARALVCAFVLAVVVSALFGFAVVAVGDPFRSLWLRIANVPQQDLQEMLLFGRNAGLSSHISTFGRQLAVVIPLALAGLLFSDCAPAGRPHSGLGKPWWRRIALAAWFVLLMLLVTAMFMNATRSVVLSVLLVAAAVLVLALLSRRARRRFLVFAPLAALWLFVYFNADELAATPSDNQSFGVGGVRADMQELAAGEGVRQPGEADRVGHVFVDNRPGVEYQVQVRERYLAGYGQPGLVTVRADEQGTFTLTWRKRPDVSLYQFRLRARGEVEWPEWYPFEPSLGLGEGDQDARVALRGVVVGNAWPADEPDDERVGHRLGGFEPGARYEVALKPEVLGDRGETVQLPVAIGEDGAFVMTWLVPRNVGVMGYVYRMRLRGDWWERWRDLEPSIRVVAPQEVALPDLAVGSESLAAGGGNARVGHAFGGFVPWFWYAVQVRQRDGRGGARVGEATVKPDEGGNFVLTWGEPPEGQGTVSHQFRAHDISRDKWSPWQDFAPSLSSRVPNLELVAGDADPAAQERRHTLEGLAVGLSYRAQLRARNRHGFGAETQEIDVIPTTDGTWTFAWQEPSAGAARERAVREGAITGYQFRLWWSAKDRWWPWQDFTPGADGSGRTKVNVAGRLDRQEQNVEVARTTELLDDASARKTIFDRLTDSSAGTRLHELTTVLRYVRDHPFGAGVYAPAILHVSYGVEDWRLAELLRLWPHNQGLHVLALFGWPGLALLVAFYVCVLRPVLRCSSFGWRAADSDLRFLTIGVVGAWAAYSINSLLVPTGPFLGGWSHFYLIGLLFGVERLAAWASDGHMPTTGASGTVR